MATRNDDPSSSQSSSTLLPSPSSELSLDTRPRCVSTPLRPSAREGSSEREESSEADEGGSRDGSPGTSSAGAKKVLLSTLSLSQPPATSLNPPTSSLLPSPSPLTSPPSSDVPEPPPPPPTSLYVPITVRVEPYYDIFITPITLTTPPTAELVRLLHAFSKEIEQQLDDPASSLVFLRYFFDRSTLISATVLERAKAGMSYAFDKDEAPWTGTPAAWEQREDDAEEIAFVAYDKALNVHSRVIDLLEGRTDEYLAELEVANAVQEVENESVWEFVAKGEEKIREMDESILKSLRTIAFLDGVYAGRGDSRYKC